MVLKVTKEPLVSWSRSISNLLRVHNLKDYPLTKYVTLHNAAKAVLRTSAELLIRIEDSKDLYALSFSDEYVLVHPDSYVKLVRRHFLKVIRKELNLGYRA